ncbi:hypothetical protein B7D66_04535 [Klebsiella pneumoniae]|nr:hypothetical protein B7D66_04535 [Klebsiella pneumoniae]
MRRTFTAEEKASVFELWKNGTGFSEIANILGSKPGTIFTMLRDTGNIITAINNLFDCFNFKLFGITLTAHGHLSLSHLK